MRPIGVQRLNWFWVLAYTAGLTEYQKRDRRDEVRSDMFEEESCATSFGASVLAQEQQVLSRMVRGVLGDLAWRWQAGHEAELVVRDGGSAPMPWLSAIFLGSIIAFGAIGTTQAEWLGDSHVALAMFAMIGAGTAWLGLHLATHSHAGPVLVAAGSACIAWSLWWTLIVPALAVVVAISGVRRAQRLERLIQSC